MPNDHVDREPIQPEKDQAMDEDRLCRLDTEESGTSYPSVFDGVAGAVGGGGEGLEREEGDNGVVAENVSLTLFDEILDQNVIPIIRQQSKPQSC